MVRLAAMNSSKAVPVAGAATVVLGVIIGVALLIVTGLVAGAVYLIQHR